jgi:PucR C-terminal helix-turn-helix domain/GGDEF-like domain
MRGLLLRLSALDPDAETSLRLIEYFDELLASRASMDAIVRATAMVAECTAGVRDDRAGHVTRIDLHGVRSPAVTASVVAERTLRVEGTPVGRVWLERDESHTFDEMVVERMELTVAARWAARSVTARAADPALVELVISDSSSEEDRHRALRLLGFAPDRNLRVLAARARPGNDLADAVRSFSSGMVGSVARAAVMGERAAIIEQSAQSTDEIREAAAQLARVSVCVGVGPRVTATRARESWLGAATAVRFVSVWPRASGPVAFEELGSIAALAEIPIEAALANRDVQVLEQHAARASGRLDVETLLSFVRDGSLRTAGAGQHMHHSSIANRLRHVEQALGIAFDDPASRIRAQTAAILWGLNCTEPPAA